MNIRFAASVFFKLIVAGIVISLLGLLVYLMVKRPVPTITITAVVATAVVIIAVVSKKVSDKRDTFRAVKTFDENPDYTLLNNVIDMYEGNFGKLRQYIAEVLDRYFDARFKQLFAYCQKVETSANHINSLNNTIQHYIRFRPEEAAKILTKRNGLFLAQISEMIDRGNDLVSIMNHLAFIEKNSRIPFMVSYNYQNEYFGFKSALFALTLPIAEKIFRQTSSESSLTFTLAYHENIVGVLIETTPVTLDSEGLHFDSMTLFIPYSHIPDFDNEEFEEKLPLVTDNHVFLYITPSTVGARLLKIILSMQRKRVAPGGGLPEKVAEVIKQGFDKIKHERTIAQTRKHEEEMKWLRESYCNAQCYP